MLADWRGARSAAPTFIFSASSSLMAFKIPSLFSLRSSMPAVVVVVSRFRGWVRGPRVDQGCSGAQNSVRNAVSNAGMKAASCTPAAAAHRDIWIHMHVSSQASLSYNAASLAKPESKSQEQNAHLTSSLFAPCRAAPCAAMLYLVAAALNKPVNLVQIDLELLAG
jgi:hypothetical protein